MIQRRIPRTVRLPFGYTITVRQVTRAEIDRARDQDCEHLEGDLDSLFSPDGTSGGTIFLVKTLPMTRKRYMLTHEMIHSVADWQHAHLNEGTARP